MGRGKRLFGLVLSCLLLSGETEGMAAEQASKKIVLTEEWEEETEEAELAGAYEKEKQTDAEAEELLAEGLDLGAAQKSLDELLGRSAFSLREAVLALVKGESPWSLDTLKELAKEAFFGEMEHYRKTAAYLLAIILASAFFSSFMTAFDKGQIAQISYYTMYLLMMTLLMKVFSSMSQIALQAVSSVLLFMEALIPVCIAALYLSSGSITAAGFSQVSLLAVAGVEWVLKTVLLPGVQIYVIVLFINQLMKEDYLSKMADLVRTGILWCLKSVTAVIFGMQAIQCMMAPAVDQMKTSAVSRAVSAIPGVGGAYETVTHTVLGAAAILKNAVGIAGVVSLVLLELVPVVKLAAGILLYRALGAAAQPVTDKRVSECIDSVAAGGELLLKIVLYAAILFMLSLALITVLVRGGG